MPAHIFNGFVQNLQAVNLIEIACKIQMIPELQLLQRLTELLFLLCLLRLQDIRKAELPPLAAGKIIDADTDQAD